MFRKVFKFRHKLNYLKKLNLIEIFLILLLIWATLWPLLYPNWRTNGFKQINDNNIENDVSICNLIVNNSDINENKAQCPVFAPNLVSYFEVLKKINNSLIESISMKYDIRKGGKHSPKDCKSIQKVAIIVPFRNRLTHLQLFVQHIHPFLNKQLIDYTLFIVEQNDSKAFNRGKLFNIGFTEANKLDQFCCFIFHDIDLLPFNQKQLYLCSEYPRHMCSALDKFRYVLLYPELFGGVVAITKDYYQLVNGYSNQFEGWGGEDDQFFARLKDKNLMITRWSPYISRCIMLYHKTEKPNPNRMTLLKEGNTHFDSDGLNDLKDSYRVISIDLEPLYTHIKAKL